MHDANVKPFNVWNTQWKTCRPIYVDIVSNILSQVILQKYIYRNLARSHQSRHHTGRRDTNPWKSKIWGLSLLHYPPPPPPPWCPDKLRTLHVLTWSTDYHNSLLWSWGWNRTMNQRKLEFALSLHFFFIGGRVRLHIGYIQKGLLGGTSRFEALINRCSKEVSNEDYYSAQEIMHHLLPLKLTSCSFNVVPINLNGPRRVKVNRTDADIYNSWLYFWHWFKMPKICLWHYGNECHQFCKKFQNSKWQANKYY